MALHALTSRVTLTDCVNSSESIPIRRDLPVPRALVVYMKLKQLGRQKSVRQSLGSSTSSVDVSRCFVPQRSSPGVCPVAANQEEQDPAQCRSPWRELTDDDKELR